MGGERAAGIAAARSAAGAGASPRIAGRCDAAQRRACFALERDAAREDGLGQGRGRYAELERGRGGPGPGALLLGGVDDQIDERMIARIVASTRRAQSSRNELGHRARQPSNARFTPAASRPQPSRSTRYASASSCITAYSMPLWTIFTK